MDDHQMLIDGIKSLLQDEPQFEIVGDATNGKLALESLRNKPIDILLTDIKMPVMDGIELCKLTRKEFPNIRILALSMYASKDMISTMLDAGVSGYILKNTGKNELINALKQIRNGGLFFANDVASEMMKVMVNQDLNDGSAPLTQRELEVLELITKEYNNAKIADKLFISERTVESHRKNIFRKTNTKSIVGLIKYAYEQKLIN